MLRRDLLSPVLGLLCSVAFAADAQTWQSHAPQRPLPTPNNNRPLADGPTYYTSLDGDDAGPGTKVQPWRTVGHAVTKLKAGDTLVLRGGVYHEHVRATLVGTFDKPITIRSAPGELAILDGGYPEFLESPATSWEPCPDGVPGEFRSTKVYPKVGAYEGDLRVGLLGNFADSMTPLHGYWHRPDLQSDNPYWTLGGGDKVKPDAHVYCGPGLWYNPETEHFHCRLAHTKLPGLGDDNYRGETDPRKVPMIVSSYGAGNVLRLEDSRHVRLQDLVLRGSRQPTLWIDGGANLELDGVTSYGGGHCMKVDGVHGFRMVHSACRGLAAPWTFRGSLKYRSLESRLFSSGHWDPSGADGRFYEMSYCEFTDSVDGVFIGNVHETGFRFNLVENVSDDGMFLTAGTGYDGETHGGPHFVHQNRFARNLTCFAFGTGHGRQKIIKDGPDGRWGTKQLGGGVAVVSNVFDFRRPVMYEWPTGPDAPQEITSLGRLAGDHGSPGWEKMVIQFNTIIAGDPPRYEYGTDGFSRAVGNGSSRKVYSNIVVQLRGVPGNYLPRGDEDYEAKANLLYGITASSTGSAPPKPRYPRDYTPPLAEWGAGDLYVDPEFMKFDADWRMPVDLRLQPGSPAIGASNIETSIVRDNIPVERYRNDLGAIRSGHELWRVGVHGRMDVCGNILPPEDLDPDGINPYRSWGSTDDPDSRLLIGAKPAAVVTGYPAFDAPLVAYALRKRGVKVTERERTWLDPREFAKYKLVAIDGSFARAKLTTTKFADDEIPIVRKFLEDGGTLWLCRERTDAFAGDAGRKFLEEVLGPQPRDPAKDYAVRLPEHPWVAHLQEPGADVSWLDKPHGGLHLARGETIIGTSSGKAILARVPVGKGQLILTWWSPAASIPNGRDPKTTVADERRFDDQMRVITNIAAELYPAVK